MKVLIDTNVILDIALKRQPFFEDAARLLKAAGSPKLQFYITATTVTDLYYIIRKAKGRAEALGFVRDLLVIVDVAGVDRLVILDALDSDLSDFEDAVQCAAAEQENISTIITRNEADFAQSGLTVLSPSAFLESLK
jgi:predicted nucleic acid-binding protein